MSGWPPAWVVDRWVVKVSGAIPNSSAACAGPHRERAAIAATAVASRARPIGRLRLRSIVIVLVLVMVGTYPLKVSARSADEGVPVTGE